MCHIIFEEKAEVQDQYSISFEPEPVSKSRRSYSGSLQKYLANIEYQKKKSELCYVRIKSQFELFTTQTMHHKIFGKTQLYDFDTVCNISLYKTAKLPKHCFILYSMFINPTVF